MRSVLLSLCITYILVPTSAVCTPSKRKLAVLASDDVAGVSLTRVRSGAPVYVVATTRRGREVRHLNVEVRNVGRFLARGVEVRVELGGGIVYPLRGPRTLEAGHAGLYVLRGGVSPLSTGAVRVVSLCANCRR